MPSLVNIFCRCHSTVRADRNSSGARSPGWCDHGPAGDLLLLRREPVARSGTSPSAPSGRWRSVPGGRARRHPSPSRQTLACAVRSCSRARARTALAAQPLPYGVARARSSDGCGPASNRLAVQIISGRPVARGDRHSRYCASSPSPKWVPPATSAPRSSGSGTLSVAGAQASTSWAARAHGGRPAWNVSSRWCQGRRQSPS